MNAAAPPNTAVRAGIASGFLILTSAAQAQTAGSLHYTLAPVALDAAGLTSTGNHYTLNSSAMAGGAGFSTKYTALTGYAGQLKEPASAVPDVVGIALRASPASIDENGSRQISADVRHADGSWTPLSGNLVTWSVESGPVSSVNSAGVATGSPVYTNTAAVVRGQYLTFSATLQLTVLDTLKDNFGSYAGDGLPDDWQIEHFGLNNPNAAPLADPDGDGFDNRFEYDACLDPADRFSTLHMFITGTFDGPRYVSFFPFFDGCQYTLRASSDLMSWSPVAGPVSDNGNLRTIRDDTSLSNHRFYQLDVRRE